MGMIVVLVDLRAELLDAAASGLWTYAHNRVSVLSCYRIFGYAYVPPSPFMLKDWERYDVSQFVDPGCLSPEEGRRTAGPSAREIRFTTIAAELKGLTGGDDLTRAICLFHCPPHGCRLDRAAPPRDGRLVHRPPPRPDGAARDAAATAATRAGPL